MMNVLGAPAITETIKGLVAWQARNATGCEIEAALLAAEEAYAKRQHLVVTPPMVMGMIDDAIAMVPRPTTAPEVCRRGTSPNDMIGAACSNCGHTNVAHPGNHNPSLFACAICEIQAVTPARPPT